MKWRRSEQYAECLLPSSLQLPSGEVTSHLSYHCCGLPLHNNDTAHQFYINNYTGSISVRLRPQQPLSALRKKRKRWKSGTTGSSSWKRRRGRDKKKKGTWEEHKEGKTVVSTVISFNHKRTRSFFPFLSLWVATSVIQSLSYALSVCLHVRCSYGR